MFDHYLNSPHCSKDIESSVSRHVKSKETFVISAVKWTLVNFKNTKQRQDRAKLDKHARSLK